MQAVSLRWQLWPHLKVALFIVFDSFFYSGQYWALPLQVSCWLSRWSESPGALTHSLVHVGRQGPEGLVLVVQHEQGVSNDTHIEALLYQFGLYQFERAGDLQGILQRQWL